MHAPSLWQIIHEQVAFAAACIQAADDDPNNFWAAALSRALPEQAAARVMIATGRGGDSCEAANTDHGLKGSKWANSRGYWDNRSMVRQVNLLISIFNIKYPDYEMVLVVDHSSGHYAVSEAALNADGMNLNPGGKQDKLDDGFFYVKDDGGQATPIELERDGQATAAGSFRRVVQPLCDDLQNFDRIPAADVQGVPCVWYRHKGTGAESRSVPVCAQAKGLRNVLVERFKAGALYATGEPMLNDPQKMTLADARLEMAKFPDFIASISRLELLCARWNHTCLFLPKFHPELNPIELVWRDSKNELRRWCKCTSVRMKERWAETLDAITPVMIRKYFKSAMEFEAVYDLTIGFGNDPDPNAKVQLYQSHRRTFKVDAKKVNSKKKMKDSVPAEHADEYLVKTKKKDGNGKWQYTVEPANVWGLLAPLREHLAKEVTRSEAMAMIDLTTNLATAAQR